jgi:RHS repeat-associated protein
MHSANLPLTLSIAISIGIRTLRCRVLVLLVCTALGVFTYDAIATTPFSPPDLPYPNNLLKRITGFFDADPATDPPLPSIGRVTRGAPLNAAMLESLNGPTSMLSLNTTLPTAVGRTVGSHEISEMGVATYAIPIWTPPGVRGIEPHLALVYGSGTPDSLLGPGWSLSGLSSITRCPRTWVQDGTPGAVALALSDKFCLDGNRLRSTGGTYGAPGSTYQTEIETFSRVTAQGVAGNGPQWFEVKGKDGLIYEYGRTSDARVFATGSSSPYLWALNKVSDRSGNNLTLTYAVSGGAHRPLAIAYTQAPAVSATYPYVVTFSYQTRVASIYQFVAGFLVQETQLLSAISIQHSGATIRTYNLQYETAPATQRDRLTAVQECTATDCLRPTTVTYQSGGAGWAGAAIPMGSNAPYGSFPIDLSGDGIPDLLFAGLNGSVLRWYARIGSATGYGPVIDAGFNTSTTGKIIPGRFSGTSKIQFLAPQGGTWYVYTYNGTGITGASTGLAASSEQRALDYDGDGLSDLVSATTALGGSAHVRRNMTAPGGAVTFSGTTQTIFTAGLNARVLIYQGVMPLDMDADGREDLLIGTIANTKAQRESWSALLSSGFGPAPISVPLTPSPDRAIAGDWNGDGCSDVVSPLNIYISNCAGGFTTLTTAVNSVGAGVIPFLAADWDSDGRSDLLYVTGGVWHVQRSTGSGLAPPLSLGIVQPSSGSTYTKTFYVVDQNADGQPDLGVIDANAGHAISYHPHAGTNAPPDLARSFTDGLGMVVSFTYAATTGSNSCYGRDSGPPAFPSSAFVLPTYVACTLTASNGIGGTYQVTHSYHNSNVHLQGRGWLGFERHYSIDNRNGIVEMESYAQSFPYIGMPTYRLARQADWTTKIREIAHTPASVALGSGWEARSFPYVSESVEDAFEVGGSLNGQVISRVTTTKNVDNFGNPSVVTVSVTDRSTSSPWNGETFTTRTESAITNDISNWCLGQPTQTSVTSTLPDGTSQTRTTAMSVDYTYCRATQVVIEPASSTLRTTTSYGFDACGNVNSVSTVGRNPNGTDMPARTTTANYGARCQFPESTRNALNQTTQRTFRYDLGLVSSETDPNGLTTSWLYDGYGRRTQERRADSTRTTWNFWFCDASNNYCGVADLRWAMTQSELDTAGSVITQKLLFHDGFNRIRYDERWNLAGGLTYFTTVYDALGRKSVEYVPVSTGGWHYHGFSYDLLNRPTADRLYTAGGALDRQSIVAYDGRKSTLTDPKGNVTTRYTDVRGSLRRVVDPAPGGTTSYTWDHFGNLLSMTDPIGAASSATYDVRGFKRTSFDPDAGAWSYIANSLGELVSQTDANGRVTTLGYDLLGRLTSRVELEGTSRWVWGNSAAAKNVGKLQSVNGPGYSEAYTYDASGRPAAIAYSADKTYSVNFGYHPTTGFLDNVTYPVSTSGYRLRAQYIYTRGILSQVRDFNAPSTVWWQVVAEDARGNPIDEQFGNGVHVLSNYDDLTGHLNWRTSGNNAQYNNHQNLSYAWDKNENLDQRVDANQSNLTERFTYDALERLTGSTLNGATDLVLGLNAAGNITSKVGLGTESHVDIGNYTYHPVKRHAVTATSNGWTFTYDANGNMLTGRGSTITWYSYNLPKTITNGSLSSQFFYTPDRRYWRQDANYSTGSESTVYIGGLLEKVTSASGTQYRHSIRAGSADIVVSRHSNGTNNTYYATQDSLGSTAVITNASGTVVVTQNFGPFGNRRGGTWRGTPSPSEWTGIASTTRRGFTGHTMVDNLNRIHMNGRMYDPFLGRFLSPDPFVQSLAASQALNPYSYCWNNPLKYIDPSGFSIFSRIWKGIKGFFESVLRDLNLVVGAVLTAVGLVTGNYGLVKAASVLAMSPVRVVNGPRGYGLAFVWGFGAGTASAATSTGPPLGTPGINPTPQIPGLMSMSGMGIRAGDYFFTDSLFWHDVLNRAAYVLTPGYAASVEMERAFWEGRYVHAAGWLAVGLSEMFLAVLSAGGGQAVNAVARSSFIIRSNAAAPPATLVIGKINDLRNVAAGERTLLDRLPNLGSPKLNWQQNAGLLRQEMSRGLPIRDASVDATGALINNTGFLKAERNLLQSNGWSYDSATRMWYPPGM